MTKNELQKALEQANAKLAVYEKPEVITPQQQINQIEDQTSDLLSKIITKAFTKCQEILLDCEEQTGTMFSHRVTLQPENNYLDAYVLRREFFGESHESTR